MNRSKAKGTAFETALVRWLRAHGWEKADRCPARGSNDCGDVSGVLDGDVVIECKDAKELRLRDWCDEAEIERARAGATYSFVALKRSGTTSPAQAYAIMRVYDMNALLLELAALREQVGRR